MIPGSAVKGQPALSRGQLLAEAVSHGRLGWSPDGSCHGLGGAGPAEPGWPRQRTGRVWGVGHGCTGPAGLGRREPSPVTALWVGAGPAVPWLGGSGSKTKQYPRWAHLVLTGWY